MFNLSPEALQELKAFRKEIHRHPELGYTEKGTTDRIENFLRDHGVAFHRFENLTGGYALIDAGGDRTLGFRCDIDALPLTENTGVDFASQTPGIMHACGHDMHTAIGAGLAVALNQNKGLMHRSAVVLFQPAEECNPRGGAKPVIETGFLKNLKISEMYGMHVWPSLPVGTIALRAGTLMGASDHFRIEIGGKKSHAAEPHRGVDAISIAAQVYTALVHRLRREVSPFSGSLVSIGGFNSTGRYNVICDHVTLEGTLRSTDAQSRDHVRARIPEIVRHIAEAERGSAEVFLDSGFGIVDNDKGLFESFSSFAAERLGDDKVKRDITPSMIGEDFSVFCAEVPSLYCFMGCDCPYPLHSDRFIPQEGCLEAAVNLFSNYFLNRKF
jgi:amidohydrolase